MEEKPLKIDDELIIEFSPEVGENSGFYDTLPNLFAENYVNSLIGKYNQDASRLSFTGNIKSMIFFIGSILENYQVVMEKIHVTNEMKITDLTMDDSFGQFEEI